MTDHPYRFVQVIEPGSLTSLPPLLGDRVRAITLCRPSGRALLRVSGKAGCRYRKEERVTRKQIRTAALREARQAAIAHSNYGALSGNRRAFKIADAIEALIAKEGD